MGIEPTSTAWEAVVLPMNYIRMTEEYYSTFRRKKQEKFFLPYGNLFSVREGALPAGAHKGLSYIGKALESQSGFQGL